LVQVCKGLGRPLPRFSEDDVLDYMISESLACKLWEAEEKAAKKRERDAWKKRPLGSGN
jgi:hypothetical protein